MGDDKELEWGGPPTLPGHSHHPEDWPPNIMEGHAEVSTLVGRWKVLPGPAKSGKTGCPIKVSRLACLPSSRRGAKDTSLF